MKNVNLKFDWNALSDFEDQYDMSIMYALDKKKLGLSVIRGLYWAGMRHEKPNITVEEVGTMLEKAVQSGEVKFADLADPLLKALDKSGLLGVKLSGDSAKN